MNTPEEVSRVQYINKHQLTVHFFKKLKLEAKSRESIVQLASRTLSPYIDLFVKLSQIMSPHSRAVDIYPPSYIDNIIGNGLQNIFDCVIQSIARYKDDFGQSYNYSINIGDSDLHPNSNMIIIITGDYGSWVYRPRRVNTDFFIKSLIEEFQLKPDFNVPKIPVKKADYYWQEYISIGKGVKRIDWNKAGVFLAIAQIIGFTDLHSNNVIWNEDSIWLFDTETIFQKLNTFQSTIVFIEENNIHASDTPLTTGILPIIREGVQGRFIDCALYGKVEEPFFDKVLSRLYDRKNVSDLIEGYRSLACDNDVLTRILSTISSLGKITFRDVKRATSTYGKLINYSIKSNKGKNTCTFTNEIRQSLEYNNLVSDEYVDQEVSAIVDGCIPFFTKKLSLTEISHLLTINFHAFQKNIEVNTKIIDKTIFNSLIEWDTHEPISSSIREVHL